MTKKMLALNIVITICMCLLAAACSSSVRFSSKSTKAISKSSYRPDTDKKKQKPKPTEVQFGQIDKTHLPKIRRAIIDEAETWYGTPYCYGGEDRRCTDCSGFVMRVFEKTGIILPRTAEQQSLCGKPVDLGSARPGDLVFFKNSGGKVSHVAIYVGQNIILHASSSIGVTMQDLDKFGKDPVYYCCRNVIN